MFGDAADHRDPDQWEFFIVPTTALPPIPARSISVRQLKAKKSLAPKPAALSDLSVARGGGLLNTSRRGLRGSAPPLRGLVPCFRPRHLRKSRVSSGAYSLVGDPSSRTVDAVAGSRGAQAAQAAMIPLLTPGEAVAAGEGAIIFADLQVSEATLASSQYHQRIDPRKVLMFHSSSR